METLTRAFWFLAVLGLVMIPAIVIVWSLIILWGFSPIIPLAIAGIASLYFWTRN